MIDTKLFISFITFLYLYSKSNSKKQVGNAIIPSRVGVGIGVIVYNQSNNSILIGLRKGSHGSNKWALPGGWLEREESFINCAVRELTEECNLKREDLINCQVLDIAPSNNIEYNSASVFVGCVIKPSSLNVIQVMEPRKCECWKWYPMETVLSAGPLFYPLEYVIQNYASEIVKKLNMK